MDYAGKYSAQQDAIKENYATFEMPYNGTDNNDYVDGEGFCCDDGSMEAAQTRAMAKALEDNFQEGDAYENLQFYYHSDHLGSSSYITNLDGEVVQHIEYVPFGEVFIEERNNIWNTPYLFNAKEFDEETGLYYYGARYYDPRLSLWISTDAMEEKYPRFSSYNFCENNPITILDIEGDSTILYATTLPGMTETFKAIGGKFATHTFLAVQNSDGKWEHFAYGSEYNGVKGAFGGRLQEVDYYDDISVMNGRNTERIKARIPIEPPTKADGSKMTVEEFDKRVIEIAKSFGNNPKITYFLSPVSNLQGNCNTSSSTILHKAGISDEYIKDIRKQLPGLTNGFGSYRPWTSEEQRNAVNAANRKKIWRNIINQNFWSNWQYIK